MVVGGVNFSVYDAVICKESCSGGNTFRQVVYIYEKEQRAEDSPLGDAGRNI